MRTRELSRDAPDEGACVSLNDGTSDLIVPPRSWWSAGQGNETGMLQMRPLTYTHWLSPPPPS